MFVFNSFHDLSTTQKPELIQVGNAWHYFKTEIASVSDFLSV